MNLYGYADDDPVNGVDPSGMGRVFDNPLKHDLKPPPTLDDIIKDVLRSAFDPPPPPHGMPVGEAPGPPIAETEEGAAAIERWLLKRAFRRSSAGRAVARAAKAAEKASAKSCPPVQVLTDAERASELGYSRVVPPNAAPFNSHGQQVFF
jgi:hypothetical protein